MDHISSLNDVYVDQLQDLYSVESQLLDALPTMAAAVADNKLRAAMQKHLDVTGRQRDRLVDILTAIGQKPGKEHCKGMEGILKEGQKVINIHGVSAAKDAALIGAAQRIEHYEIAAYGTAVAMANELGYSDAADLLETSLDEEKDTDANLSKLATGGILRAGINERAQV